MSNDAKDLLGWFGKRKEDVVNNGMKAHSLAVHDCVMELGTALRQMMNDEGSNAMKSIDRLIINEREADSIEDNLSAQLSTGDLDPQEREDLLHFVRKTDTIANWCKEAALYVQLIKETGITVPKGIWEQFVGIAADLESEMNYLLNAINTIDNIGDEMEVCIKGVRDQERRIDQSTFQAIKDINMSDMDARAIILAMKVVDALEMASDTMKGCADTIHILMVSRRL